MAKITGSCDTYNNFEEGGNDTFNFKFTIYSGISSSTFHIYQPYQINKDEWDKMIDALRNNKMYSLVFLCGHSVGEMSCNGDNVFLKSQASEGIGDDVCLSIEYTQSILGPLFADVLEELFEHETVKSYYAEEYLVTLPKVNPECLKKASEMNLRDSY